LHCLQVAQEVQQRSAAARVALGQLHDTVEESSLDGIESLDEKLEGWTGRDSAGLSDSRVAY
jgi:hypothetical protein